MSKPHIHICIRLNGPVGADGVLNATGEIVQGETGEDQPSRTISIYDEDGAELEGGEMFDNISDGVIAMVSQIPTVLDANVGESEGGESADDEIKKWAFHDENDTIRRKGACEDGKQTEGSILLYDENGEEEKICESTSVDFDAPGTMVYQREDGTTIATDEQESDGNRTVTAYQYDADGAEKGSIVAHATDGKMDQVTFYDNEGKNIAHMDIIPVFTPEK